MGAEMINRRTLIAGGLALPLIASASLSAAPVTERLAVGARATDVTIWAAREAKGVALFSTGHGSWPERYAILAGLLVSQGWTVVAPLHVDSVRHPDRARFTMQASFGERIADMAAASALAARRWPKLPVTAVGHSFGTLTALCRAGGLAYLGDFRDPSVTAVLGFSSPGRIPGLVQSSAYATVSAPLLLVTGTADTVPGFVSDPADHLFPAETAKGPSFALVRAGADHEWVGRDAAGVRATVEPIGLFLRREFQRLARWTPAAGDRFVVRNAA